MQSLTNTTIYPKILNYFALLKPRVMALVIFTSFSGYILSPHSCSPFFVFIGILSISIAAGASGCLNQWYEAETDALMERTKNRPVASGKITKESALSFGIILSVISLIMMQAAFGLLQTFLLAFTIWFYAYFYTIILKPRTPQNIVWGGISGALPPVIGYSLGGTIDIYAFVLFLIIFFWTPPHFWALSMTLKDDYKKAGIPLMPTEKGEVYTKKLMIFYGILTSLSSLLLLYLRETNIFHIISYVAINIYWFFLILNNNFTKNKNIKLFLFSILYLFLIFFLASCFH
jgi:protoheme IX farnesyltransferase